MAKRQTTVMDFQPASEKARLGILKMIRSGAIPSGHRVDQRIVAKKLNLTTAPIREALSSLETDGHLHRIPSVGIFCKAYTVDEIEEVIELRSVLEGLAAKRAAARITDSERARIISMAQKISSDFYQTDEEYLKAHIDFHAFVTQLSRSSQLIRLQERNLIIEQVLFNVSAKIWPVHVHDHIGIAEELCSGDPIKAELAFKNHIAPTFTGRLEKLREKYGNNPIIFDQD